MANYGQYKPLNHGEYQICCITMNMSDRLRLLACPPEIIPLMRECIQLCWGNIQDERPYHGSHEFKIRGNPWWGNGDDAVYSRRLLAGVLKVMAKQGWNLLQSTDCSKKDKDKDTMFFEKGVPDPQASLFALSFNKGDRIRIIDAPAFMPYLKQAVAAMWPRGIQNEREYYGSLELKLSGYPWYPYGADAVQSKMLLCQIIANFRSVGYKLYASVDISSGSMGMGNGNHDEGRDLDSWVFRKMGENWH